MTGWRFKHPTFDTESLQVEKILSQKTNIMTSKNTVYLAFLIKIKTSTTFADQ